VLGQSNEDAANNVSKWTGTVYMFSLIGAFLSDSYWGRYKTCAIFQAIFVLVSRTRLHLDIYIHRTANIVPSSVCQKEFPNNDLPVYRSISVVGKSFHVAIDASSRRHYIYIPAIPCFYFCPCLSFWFRNHWFLFMHTCKQTHVLCICTYNTKATIIRL
jgi:hypothetical protein